MNDFLTKPLNFPTVISTINHWLEHTPAAAADQDSTAN
ncbi:MAG: FixJ family two-component response regulator [Candidatus Azotimanducaceae bacterium]|jgi:FixJ family two-component response regulator